MDPDFKPITIKRACEIVGGDDPIDPSTYYRNCKPGPNGEEPLFEPPVKLGRNLSRVNEIGLRRRLAKRFASPEAA